MIKEPKGRLDGEIIDVNSDSGTNDDNDDPDYDPIKDRQISTTDIHFVPGL